MVVEIYRLTSLLPVEEKFGLKSQLQRAAVSIPSNIAEGCSRESEADFKKFLEYAIGSAFEVETQLIAVERLQLIDSKRIQPVLQIISEEQKMLNSFITSVKNRKGENIKPKT